MIKTPRIKKLLKIMEKIDEIAFRKAFPKKPQAFRKTKRAKQTVFLIDPKTPILTVEED